MHPPVSSKYIFESHFIWLGCVFNAYFRQKVPANDSSVAIAMSVARIGDFSKKGEFSN